MRRDKKNKHKKKIMKKTKMKNNNKSTHGGKFMSQT